jgi:hypothetical protein
MLDKEFKYFKDHQEELVKQHEGKYLVIVGEEVVGAYDLEIDAYTEAKKHYKPGTFLIQHCLPGKKCVHPDLLFQGHLRLTTFAREIPKESCPRL